MPWVCFRCQSGPGHQSKGKEIRWYDEVPEARQLREDWYEVFQDRDDPCRPEGCCGGARTNGKAIEVLRGLPASYLRMEISYHKHNIVHSRRMLGILSKTKSLPEFEGQWLLNGKWVGATGPITKPEAKAWLRGKGKKAEYRVVKHAPQDEDEEE